MARKMEKLMETLEDKKDDFVEDHPNLVVGAWCIATVALMVPLCYACYKWEGKIIGKEVAKQLKKHQ